MEDFRKLNYRHLFYFWMTMKEGSISKAAERLDVAVQTISMQVSTGEKHWKSPACPTGQASCLDRGRPYSHVICR